MTTAAEAAVQTKQVTSSSRTPGARHSFTVPEADSHGMDGLKYNKEADEKSWADMRKLFKKKLGK